MNIAITPEIQALLDQDAPVALGVSGGKDGHAAAWALSQALRGYRGEKVLVHADLGAIEWEDSWPACQRLADAIGWELIRCSRPAGGMLERWESRWESSKTRYADLRTVAMVLPWSTPAMRFCTSELKNDPIAAALKKRFGKVPMISATGVRGEESAQRSKQPVSKAAGKKFPAGSQLWSCIHHWKLSEVWQAISASGVRPHEAYLTYGSSRVSCRFCIMSSGADLLASLKDEAAHPIYRRMCNLELTSGFAFQGNRWLSDLRPELINPDYPNAAWTFVAMGKQIAKRRQLHEAWVRTQKHLQFTKGWPHCVPTMEECAHLAEMRHFVCLLYGLESPYVTAETVRARYQELWDEKQAA